MPDRRASYSAMSRLILSVLLCSPVRSSASISSALSASPRSMPATAASNFLTHDPVTAYWRSSLIIKIT